MEKIIIIARQYPQKDARKIIEEARTIKGLTFFITTAGKPIMTTYDPYNTNNPQFVRVSERNIGLTFIYNNEPHIVKALQAIVEQPFLPL